MKTVGAVMCAIAIVVTVVMAQGAGSVLTLEELTLGGVRSPGQERSRTLFQTRR